jgi:5-methylcytosine-specific restriction endonuclease McrA
VEKKMNRKTWIMSTLRRASYRWPPINEAEKLARKERGRYECAYCHELFKSGEYAKDHIEPIVPYSGFPIHPVTGGPDWTIIIDRLLCDVEDIQILCHSCHDQKTAIEDTMRATYNAQKKEMEKQLKKEQKLLAKKQPVS